MQSAHEAACIGHPAFPTPSLGGRSSNASGALRGEGERTSGFFVIASEAKQSMTAAKDGLLRFARNDGAINLW